MDTALTRFFFLAALFILGACSSSRKSGMTPPAANAFHLPDSLPALPLSEIDLPVKIAARQLLARTDSMIPKEFVSEGWPAYLQASCEFRYKYRFVRSGFTLSCTNNTFNLLLKGSYQVAGSRCFCAGSKPVSPWISGSCGFGKEPMRGVDIAISSRLSLLQDYRILSTTRLDQLKPGDRCVVSLLSTDITGEIMDSIRSSISSFCTTLDETLKGLDFKNYLRQAALGAWQKKPAGPYGYLVVNPEKIRVSPMNYSKDTFYFSIGLSCRPELGSDSSNRKIIPPLPPLRTEPSRDGIALYLPVSYSYPFISKVLHDTLTGKTFTVKGRKVTIRDIAVKGIGNHQIECRVDFTGSRKGRILLRGTPVLDSARQTLSIPDISYSLESRDLILKMGKALFRNKIRKSLQGNSYLDLGALIKTNLPALDSQLNRQLTPELASHGHAKAVRMIGLLAGNQTLQAQLFVQARLEAVSIGLATQGKLTMGSNH